MERRCTCSALFPTSDALNAHLDEHRSLERLLSAQLERCRSHSKADADDLDSDDHDHDYDPNGGHNCPLKECKSKPFGTLQRLTIHFWQHVKCDEICVCCGKVSTRVGDYIRHAKGHNHVDPTKSTYMNLRSGQLRKRAADELDKKRVERSNKRVREVGDVGSGVQRANKLPSINELGFQPTNAVSFTQPVTALVPPSNVAEPRGGFPNNIPAETFYPGSEHHNVDQQRRTEERMPKRTAIGAIGTLLNHDSNTLATGLATTHESLHVSATAS